MKALRIAHVDTERTWRGGEQQVFSLIEGLNGHGHSNLLIVRDGSALAERAKGLAPQMAVTPFLGEWDFIAAHFINRRLKADRIDVVHAHTAHGASLAAIATLGTTIPVVVTRRVDFPLSNNPFSRWKYSRAKRIVAISKGVKDVLIQSGIPEKKIPIVPSGIDFKRTKNIQPLTKKDLGVPEGTYLIGQVAALAPHKDQNNLLEATAVLRKSLPNIRVLIIGEGELRPILEAKVRSLGLEEVVQGAGFKQNRLDFIPAFDVFCLSSKEEGLGTSILDAMALRIPVVATKVGGIPELVETNITGYLAPPRDPQALSDTLKKALLEGGENQALLAKAVEKARNFDILNTVIRMEAIYAELSTGLST